MSINQVSVTFSAYMAKERPSSNNIIVCLIQVFLLFYKQYPMEQQTWKSTFRCFLLVTNIVLGSFYFGYTTAYMNVSQDTLNVILDIDRQNYYALFQALTPIGAAFGALLSGPLLYFMSRRQAFFFTDVLGIIGLIISLIANLNTLYLARFIIGLAVGLNSSMVPLYIKEFTPLQLSGTMGSLNQFTINFGQLTAFLMGLGYTPDPKTSYSRTYWRIVFGMPIVTNMIRILLLSTVFRDEPPGYYASKGDSDKALEVLKKMYKKAYVNDVLTEIERDERQKLQSASKYKDLISLLYKRRLQVGSFLSLLQQFCGINAIMFYSSQIFKTITTDQHTISILNVLVTTNNLVFSGVAVLLMKRFGSLLRKTLLVTGDSVCMVCLFALAAFSYLNEKANNDNILYQVFTIVFLFGFLIAFQFSLGPITWLYIPEILPEKGVSIAVLCNWIGTSIVAQAFPVLKEPLGISGCFALFAIFCLFGLFIIIFVVQETKGKTAQQIDGMYSLIKPTQVYENKPLQSDYED